MSRPNKNGGRQLRELRQSLGLSMRDVLKVSREVADRKHNRDFLIYKSLLSAIERKGVVPSIYRLHSLARAYKTSMRKLLSFYGV